MPKRIHIKITKCARKDCWGKDNLVGGHVKTLIIFDKLCVPVHYEQPAACIHY